MSADADFAKVVAALTDPRPAFVSYTERLHGHAFIDFDHSAHLVARTSDGHIVHGKATVETDTGTINHQPFAARCYRAVSETHEQREGRDVLAFHIAHRDADGCGHDNDFSSLYADPNTLHPIEVDGHSTDDKADAHLAETFGDVDGHAVMTKFRVDVDGSGPVFWLHVHVMDDFSDYRFSEKDPGR